MARIESFRDLGCLVTGASSGIGREIARLLAAEGARLVVTARRAERLEALAAELVSSGAASCEVVVADLAERAATRRIVEEAERRLGAVDALVNNAGFAVPGPFLRSDLDRTQAMLEVNVVAATALMHRLLPGMVKRGKGGALNVASVAAFQAAPYQAGYAGTKAYLLNLSESVHQEVKHAGVAVTALCPGVTDTEFFEAAGYRDLGRFMERRMDAAKVARIGVRAWKRGRMTVVTGASNRALLFAERFLPRTLVAETARRLMAGRKR
ncbi:MAG: SDR family NAD(P)-dependent oxidoreductase [Planctomycetota bacterium]